MHRLTLDLEFVTPCFLGGFDPKEAAEWRAASVRGQLRWWFRAVAGGRFAGDLHLTHRAEELVFGSTEVRSPLMVRALDPPASEAASGQGWGRPLSVEQLAQRWGSSLEAVGPRLDLGRERGTTLAVHYLGYGPIVGSSIQRRFLPPGARGRLLLQWPAPRTTAAREAFELFRTALASWLHLGGLGARSRRGFGSLRCRKAEGDGQSTPASGLVAGSFEAWKDALSAGLATPATSAAVPEWTHLSSGARIYFGQSSRGSWQEAMTDLGAWLIGFRRRYGWSREERAALAGRDKEWAEGRNGSTPTVQVPDRAGFGLPLPFRGGARVSWGQGKDARRASPLLLHVAQFGDGEFRPVLTHLPARLVPRGERLTLKGATSAPPTPAQTSIVTHFFDDLEGKSLIGRAL